MTDIKKYSSPNRFIGRKGNVPDVIVLHNTGGTGISSAHYWFLDPSSDVSAHFLVGLDGEVRQYVSLSDGAWCNGTSLDKSKASWHGNSKSPLVRSRKQNCNLYSISVEFVGRCGDALTEAQMTAATELIEYLQGEVFAIYGKRLPVDESHLLRHCDVNPKGKPTCGVNIQLDGILEALNKKRIPQKEVSVKKPLPKFRENRME